MNNIEQIYVSWANSLDSAGKDSSAVIERLTKERTAYTLASLKRAVAEIKPIEQHKKFLFYGKTIPADIMVYTGTPEQITSAQFKLQDHNVIRMLHAVMGLIGEAGEVAEVLLSFLQGDINIDEAKDKLMNEAGDVMWYQAVLQKALGHTSFAEVLTANHAKLIQRYGTQWSQEAALNRIEDGDIGDQQTRLG